VSISEEGISLTEDAMVADQVLEHSIFSDSILDASGGSRQRMRSALTSITLQAIAVGSLLVFSMLHVETLPQSQLVSRLIVPSQPPAEVHQAFHASSHRLMSSRPIMLPSYEPQGIAPEQASSAPPSVDIQSLRGNSGGVGVPFGAGNELDVVIPPPPVAAKPVRISRMMEGNLIRRIEPMYPSLARQARIQDAVVLSAVISRDGMIERLQALNGQPMLEQAAIDAVRQWRYRPYLLNGEPVEVETQITVNFTLGGR
jgi:periplasmic protein TonB